MFKHNSIDKKAESSILQLPSEVFGLARFRLSNLSSRFKSPSDNSAKATHDRHKNKCKQDKTLKDKSKYNKQLSMDAHTASKPIQRQASLNGEHCCKSFPETSCHYIEEHQARRADSEERRKPAIESICLFPKLVLPIYKAGDAPPKSPDLSEKPRKKLSFREPEIVTKESSVHKHDTLIENGNRELDINEMELENQALRIVRSVGQAFDVCKDFSLEGDNLVLNQIDAERENDNTEDVAHKGNGNEGSSDKLRSSFKLDPLKGQLYEVQQMLLKDQNLDLEDFDYDAIQPEINTSTDLSTNKIQEAPFKDIDTLDTYSHDSNETNQSDVASENASKGPPNNTFSTDTCRKPNVKQEMTFSEERKQYLSDNGRYEKGLGFHSDAQHGFSENLEFNNRHRIRTPETINDLRNFWQKGEAASNHTSKSELPSPVFATNMQDFESKSDSNISICNVQSDPRNLDKGHSAQSLEATARDFADWIKLNGEKLDLSDELPKHDNTFLLKLFGVILDYQDELGKLTEKLQTYESLLHNVYYQLIKFLGVNTCVSTKMKTLSGDDKHNVHLLTLILLLKELENDMVLIKDTVYSQLLSKCSEDHHQEQNVETHKDITTDTDSEVANEGDSSIRIQTKQYQPITFHYHPHLGGYVAYSQAQNHDLQEYVCVSEDSISQPTLEIKPCSSQPLTPTSPKFEETSPTEVLRQKNNQIPIFLPPIFGAQSPYHTPRAGISNPAILQAQETNQTYNYPVLFLPRIPASQIRPVNQRASIPRPNTFQTSIPRPVNPTFNNNKNSENEPKNSKNQ